MARQGLGMRRGMREDGGEVPSGVLSACVMSTGVWELGFVGAFCSLNALNLDKISPKCRAILAALAGPLQCPQGRRSGTRDGQLDSF
ncbi:unnamed protein product [Bursaphelenchus xylophilus]|uniref:(pine wood nematode) hypothetical protein n=1 Tax=Bursaphelenchus xylophilus TaxID=6326 RepID=A0A1I7S2E3_BURXY|nr:unnamed protein product [Bursaphelenchus xylophilus]CAG9114626.1 unnamed protein product [Bursaphelenchus xylophilus]